jgi:hypothetical protein
MPGVCTGWRSKPLYTAIQNEMTRSSLPVYAMQQVIIYALLLIKQAPGNTTES